jgi:hypothetical protein
MEKREKGKENKIKGQLVLNRLRIFLLFFPYIVNDYNLLVPTDTQFVLVYFTLSGSYMFRLFAIFRELTTE